MQPTRQELAADAREQLAKCEIDEGADFFGLSNAQVSNLALQAALHRYRKPREANGSTCRYYYQLLVRRIRGA